MKETFSTTVTVSGKGDSKAKAFADALSRVQHTVLRNTNKILLRIEPQDVKVLRAQEQVRTEKFLFFFLARERKNYQVELEVTVNVTSFDGDKIDFTRA
ncbi:cytoplasmic protein [Enterobacterales bacterium CwR94]|nr:cytoplasmic protein [Enterobacterales bacterium CwR94]